MKISTVIGLLLLIEKASELSLLSLLGLVRISDIKTQCSTFVLISDLRVVNILVLASLSVLAMNF